MKKVIVLAICVISALLLLGNAVLAGENEENSNICMATDSFEAIQNGGFPQGSISYNDGVVTGHINRYNSSGNSDVESALYNGIKNYSDSIDIESYNIRANNLKAIIENVINNNPDVFNIQARYTYSYNPSTNYVLSVSFTYTMTREEYNEAYSIYYSEVKKIADLACNLDDVEKVIAVNDYICSNYEYDQSYTIRDAYNFVLYKKGVCQSYTLMFTAVMKELGVPVSYASSEAMNHIWNVVNIDDNWYHVDATWNDPIGGINFGSYHYNTLRSDQGISNERHYGWTTDVVCSSTLYDDAFWLDYERPFVPVDHLLYYIDAKERTLNSYDHGKDNHQIISEFDFEWRTADGTGYYSGMFSGLSLYEGMLYFNSSEAILLYNPSNGQVKEILNPTVSGGYIYASGVCDGYIYYTVTDGPLYSDTVYSVLLSDCMPKYTISWNVDGKVSQSTAVYGQLPSYKAGTPTKSYDDEFHYEFIGWTPEFSIVYSNQSYTADFKAEEHDYLDGQCSCGKNAPGTSYIGFVKHEFGTRYYYQDGGFAKGWATIDGKTYRFDPETGILFTESVLHGTLDYYFNADYSTVEGLVEEDGGLRFYKKGVRQISWADTDGDGKQDMYFYVSTALRCEMDRVLFDGVASRRFYKYNTETGSMEVVNGFYTNEKGTQYFINGIGKYGWITPEGEIITDRPGVTVYGAYYFTYGDGTVHYRVEATSATIGGVTRVFGEDHLVSAYTGWAQSKKTGNPNYYVEGVLQQGWCLTPDGWVYLSRSENLANNISYGDVFYEWRKIGGKVYYFRASTSNPAYVLITDPTRNLNYNGVRSEYTINQTIITGTGADYYITNPPAGF